MNCKTDEPTLVFVYGTLMSGQRAHHFLEGGTLFGTWRLHGYAMYNLGRYPGIVKNEGHHVIGEVYEIPNTLLARMDEYEEEGLEGFEEEEAAAEERPARARRTPAFNFSSAEPERTEPQRNERKTHTDIE